MKPLVHVVLNSLLSQFGLGGGFVIARRLLGEQRGGGECQRANERGGEQVLFVHVIAPTAEWLVPAWPTGPAVCPAR